MDKDERFETEETQGEFSRYTDLTDERIVELSHEGDATAEEYLLDKYKNFVRSKARSYFLVGADHEDIVQEGMIGLYKAIRDYRPDKLSSFRAFAELCITRQIITAVLRSSQRTLRLRTVSALHLPCFPSKTGSNFWMRIANSPERLLKRSGSCRNPRTYQIPMYTGCPDTTSSIQKTWKITWYGTEL